MSSVKRLRASARGIDEIFTEDAVFYESRDIHRGISHNRPAE
jgi:hypothetical protein